MTDEISRRSRVLRGLCGEGGNRVVIAHGNSPSFFADLFAVWEAGGCAVCVNPGLTPDELANVVDFVDARCVLVDDGSTAASRVPVLCSARETALAKPRTRVATGLDDPALILFTSGTTGDPKGVVHTHRSLLARLALNHAHIGSEILARSLCVLPTHFGHGLIGNCLTPLLAGGDLFLMHGTDIGGLRELGPLIERHRITFMSSVPAFWKLALRLSPPPAPGVLRRVHIGSAPLSADLWHAVMEWSGTAAVANMYGITETANWIGGALASEFAPEDGLLGRCWGGRAAILGPDGIPRGEGEGEILVQTPSLMQGYFRRPDLTEETLNDGWYHTGDIGHLDRTGILRLTGRRRYAINRAGIKVYPEELDLLFERHEDVLEACAFALPDPVSGEGVGVAIRLRDGSVLTAQELVHWVRPRIRREAVPNHVFLVAEIPKTDRGKLNRDRVATCCLGGAAQTPGVA